MWKGKENTYYSFDDKGNYKVFLYSKKKNCNLLLDSYTVNNSGKVDFKKMNSNISNVDLKYGLITITSTIENRSETFRLKKTPKVEQELASLCRLSNPSGKYVTMKDITGTWYQTVYRDGESYQLYMHINNNFANFYMTNDRVDCYVKRGKPIRFHEIGLGSFSLDNGANIVIKNGNNSITFQNKYEKSSSDKT